MLWCISLFERIHRFDQEWWVWLRYFKKAVSPMEEDTLLCIEVENRDPVLPIFDLEDLANNLDPEKFSNTYILHFVKKDDDFNTVEKVGFLEGTFINIILAEDKGMSLLDVMDSISSEISRISVILTEDEEVNEIYADVLNQNIFYINTIFIHPPYRGQGLAKTFLLNLEDVLGALLGIDVGCIILETAPFRLDAEGEIQAFDKGPQRDAAIEKLQMYYKTAELQIIENTELMYRKTACKKEF